MTAYRQAVALEIGCATAFRWRPTQLAGRESDLIRVMDDGDVKLVLMANASDGPFVSCWPAGSGLLLDLFEAEWSKSRGGLEARLRNTFHDVAIRFSVAAPSLHPPSAWEPGERPGGSLLAVVVSEFEVLSAWIGGDLAILVRDGGVVAATRPHSLLEHLRQQEPNLPVDPGQLPAVVTRAIGLTAGREDPPSVAAFGWRAGDRLILTNWSLHRGDEWVSRDIAIQSEKFSSPSALAEHLAEQRFVLAHAAYAVVAVIVMPATGAVVETSPERS